MNQQKPPHEFPQFNDDVRDAWDTNADFWNERMGEGNSFHNSLVRPSMEKLLALKQEKSCWTSPAGTATSPANWANTRAE